MSMDGPTARAAAVTPDSVRLRALAGELTEVLVARVPPAAVMLVGSAAEGSADRFSDLDLIICYERLPEPAAFRRVLADLGASRFWSGPETDTSFSDAYRLDGTEVQTGGTLVAGVEQAIDRVRSAAEPGEPRTKVVMGCLRGLALHGPELVARWRERAAAYPDALARAMVEKNLAVFPYWREHEHLTARDARLFQVQSLLDGAFKVIGVLSGLNRVYFTTFQFKRMREHVAAFEAAPPRLPERLEALFELDGRRAAEELRSLVGETVALVEARMPEVDTSAARATLSLR